MVQASLNLPSVQGKRHTKREGEIPCAKKKYKASATYQAHKIITP